MSETETSGGGGYGLKEARGIDGEKRGIQIWKKRKLIIVERNSV